MLSKRIVSTSINSDCYFAKCTNIITAILSKILPNLHKIYKINNEYANIIDFFSSNINFLSSLLFNIFSLNSSFDNCSSYNLNAKQYYKADKKILAKVKKNIKEKKKAKVKEKKKAKAEAAKKRKGPN